MNNHLDNRTTAPRVYRAYAPGFSAVTCMGTRCFNLQDIRLNMTLADPKLQNRLVLPNHREGCRLRKSNACDCRKRLLPPDQQE